VARKRTALEASQATNTSRQQLLLTFGLAMALALGLAIFAQGVGVALQQKSVSEVTQVSQRVAQDLSAYIAEQQHKAEESVKNTLVIQAAKTVNDSKATQEAENYLKEQFPDLKKVVFYSWSLSELLQKDFKELGYSRANMLAEARSRNGAARAQAVQDKTGQIRLALAQTVRQDDLVMGYVYLETNANYLLEVIKKQQIMGGIVSLQQGNLGSVLASVSGQHGIINATESSVPIPESIFTVVGQSAEFFKPGELIPAIDFRNSWALFIVSIVLFILSAWLMVLHHQRTLNQSLSALRRPFANLATKLQPKKHSVEEVIMPKHLVAEPVDLNQSKPNTTPTPVAANKEKSKALDRSIFRAYDIRGVVDETLTDETARLIGQAVGSLIRERDLFDVVVARDGRLSGARLASELIRGLRSTGCNVIDIGAVPTPVLYFATYHLNAGSGVMVTGSHNPPDYNGFKMVVGGETLAEDTIQGLYSRIAEGRLTIGSGSLQTMNILSDYHERIISDIQVERPLKVVLDAGNGIAGLIAPQVLEGIGCEVIPLYCDVDGHFPNHHPDPSDPHNLQDLILSVKRLNADIGMAFDGDGDRLGVVTAQGEIIYPDRLLMLFANDVLSRNPGAAIIYDVKCTGHLQDIILRNGGSPIMWKTGHSLIKAKMREENAELAGEMSGHFFFQERWFGFDDGIYAAARLAEILGRSDSTPQEIFDELPKGVSTPELKIAMNEGEHYAFMDQFREAADFPGARISTIDGIRADYADGWGLVRCSNTTPNLVLRFDADSTAALSRIQELFRAQLLAQDAKLKLPF
jgi:phosphomannomutase/phosphoglucomutase